jgi:hypothetical protein
VEYKQDSLIFFVDYEQDSLMFFVGYEQDSLMFFAGYELDSFLVNPFPHYCLGLILKHHPTLFVF